MKASVYLAPFEPAIEHKTVADPCVTYITYVSWSMAKSRDKLIPGTLNLLILKSLTWGPLHGYAISKWILQRTDEVFRVEEGVLYPALHRLEKDGFLTAEWGRNDTGRRAKFYDLTPAGKRLLQTETARWRRSARAVETVLGLQGA